MIYTFTFGFGHQCTCGAPLDSCYTRIEGQDSDAARERMASRWAKWAFQYASDEEAGVERFGLVELATNFDTARCPCGSQPAPPPALHPREAEIRREIACIREAGLRCAASSRQKEVPALYCFSGLLSAYADLAQHALERGIDYQYELPALGDPPAHKAIYMGEKLRQLLLPFCESEPFRAHLLSMFLQGERSPPRESAARDTPDPR